MSTDLDSWWEHLRATALVGTARREVPEWPDLGPPARPDASREETLLDSAALGDAVRRAGRLADPAPEPTPPAPDETLPHAPSPAVQVLELLLNQGPVAATARAALTVHWLETAAAAGRVVPPRLLPALLDASTSGSVVRAAVRPVLGERGTWLAARNPAWDWVLATAEHLPTSPEAVRARIEERWDTDSAQERALAVSALTVGLGPDDEPFLERCLDDRAKGVREQAQRLLDRLPTSARARRMADRLRPLISISGTLRKKLAVAVPDDPDATARRDGLVDPGPGTSKRNRWLQQIVMGAPLEVWTEATGTDPAKVLAMMAADDALVLTGALTSAAAGRGELEWARALMKAGPDTRLLAVLPGEEREAIMTRRVTTMALATLTAELQTIPRPWGPDLSRAVLAAIGRDKDGTHAVRVLRDVLPTALHPSTLGVVEKAMHAAGDDGYLRTTLRDVLQFQSLHSSISEAFR
ncbi:MAG: DUF5691 domain-containing protein [Nocardioides sp.]